MPLESVNIYRFTMDNIIARKTSEDLAKCDEFNSTKVFKQISYTDEDDSLEDIQDVEEKTS